MSCQDLEIAYDLAKQVHTMSMSLPRYELYEQGSQVRRSTKSVKDQIVEGYGIRRYKDDFIKFYGLCSSLLRRSNLTNLI